MNVEKGFGSFACLFRRRYSSTVHGFQGPFVFLTERKAKDEMTKGKSPAFQLYASDFDMDTASWDNEEVGVYFRLLMYQWVNKSVPDDINRLAKITRIGQKRFKKSWRIVSDKFQDNGKNGLINVRMERVRAEQDNYRKSQSEAGRRGIKKKKKEGIFPFSKSNKASSDPSSDPSSEKQALRSSSSSSLKSKAKTALPTQEEISESALPKIDQHIEEVCKELYDQGIFMKVYAFKNSMLKKNKSKRAILHTLSRCLIKRKFKEDPYAYCTKIINIEDGNYNESEYHKAAP